MKFPMIVTVTTLVWIIVTYVTQPESSEVLQNFYKKIQPGGPGWKKVILEARKRNIEIIGEALSRIITKDEAIKISNARKIVDTRNRIIHGYDSVSDEIIWGIVINHIPILQTEVKDLLGNFLGVLLIVIIYIYSIIRIYC